MAASAEFLLTPFSQPKKHPNQFYIRQDHIKKRNWRGTSSYRKWKMLVIVRDGGRCQCCGTDEHIHAHHIKHATYWPELKFTVSNGIALCSKCHSLFHNDMIGNTRKKCDEKQLADFFKMRSYYSGVAFSLVALTLNSTTDESQIKSTSESG